MFAYSCHCFLAYCASVIVNSDTFARLACFDGNPLSSPFEVLKSLLSQFNGCGLLCRILLANLGDRCQSVIERALNDVAAAMRWQWDCAIRDLYCAKAQ